MVVMMMMTIHSRQSFKETPPTSPLARAPASAPLWARGVNGPCRSYSRSRCVPLYRIAPLRFMPFPHVSLRPSLDHTKPSTGVLCCLMSPFAPLAGLLEVFLEAPHPIFLLLKEVALALDHLPQYHLHRQQLLSYACHEASEQYSSSAHRRLKSLGACLNKRAGVG